MELSLTTQKLIAAYQVWYKSLQKKEGVPTIHVDEVASKVASFYEKIRGVIDWKEEHLLRRAAIARSLKRRLFLQKEGKEIAEPFVSELIRGGHFPNDSIEEVKIDEIKDALDKYLFLIDRAPASSEKLKVHLYDWLLDIAACEIEEILSPPLRQKALIEYMMQLMTERIEVSGNKVFYKKLAKEDKEAQIYIAVHRALFKLDSPIISYYLLKLRYSNWSRLSSLEQSEIAANIHVIQNEIQKQLKHPLADKFYKICERYDTAYLILGDIIAGNPIDASKNLAEPQLLENSIKSAYQARLTKLKKRMMRAAIFSTISIFITKLLLALVVEIQVEKYFFSQPDYQTLGLNILIPPLLMFILVLTIRPPGKENLDAVIMEVIKIVCEKKEKDVYLIKIPRKKGFILNSIIALFYTFNFLLSFGLIIWGLRQLNFGPLSILIFLMFFCLITFAGVKIRERAKELEIMVKEKAGFFSFLMDSFSLPFIRAGRWLSRQLSKYNVILVIMIAIIDMPFQLFVEFLEQWRTFLKEKKEEIH